MHHIGLEVSLKGRCLFVEVRGSSVEVESDNIVEMVLLTLSWGCTSLKEVTKVKFNLK